MQQEDKNKEKISGEEVAYFPPRKVRGLHRLLESCHLTDFNKSSGPCATARYRQNGRSMDEVVVKINLYCLEKRLEVYAEARPESGVIDLLAKTGSGFEVIQHLRIAYPEMFGGGDNPKRDYFIQ